MSLQDGWVNTWVVDWPWCTSKYPWLSFLRLIKIFMQLIRPPHWWCVFLFVACSHIHILHSFHPSMDLTFHFQRSFCWCLLHPVRCPRSMGCCASISSLSYATLTAVHWTQIPIHLSEMSPPAFRATFPGVAYQLGNVRRVFFPSLFFFFLIIINPS